MTIFERLKELETLAIGLDAVIHKPSISVETNLLVSEKLTCALYDIIVDAAGDSEVEAIAFCLINRYEGLFSGSIETYEDTYKHRGARIYSDDPEIIREANYE